MLKQACVAIGLLGIVFAAQECLAQTIRVSVVNRTDNGSGGRLLVDVSLAGSPTGIRTEVGIDTGREFNPRVNVSAVGVTHFVVTSQPIGGGVISTAEFDAEPGQHKIVSVTNGSTQVTDRTFMKALLGEKLFKAWASENLKSEEPSDESR